MPLIRVEGIVYPIFARFAPVESRKTIFRRSCALPEYLDPFAKVSHVFSALPGFIISFIDGSLRASVPRRAHVSHPSSSLPPLVCGCHPWDRHFTPQALFRATPMRGTRPSRRWVATGENSRLRQSSPRACINGGHPASTAGSPRSFRLKDRCGELAVEKAGRNERLPHAALKERLRRAIVILFCKWVYVVARKHERPTIMV